MPTVKPAVNDLDSALQQCIELACRLPLSAWQQQYHPDLSPAGWHLGHMVFIEHYWVYEQLLDIPVSDAEKNFYFPWLSPKAQRGQQLPDRDSHIPLLLQLHQQILDALQNADSEHRLMINNYLLLFLIQHHQQHRETLHQIAMQYALNSFKDNFSPGTTVSACNARPPDIEIKSDTFMLGHDGGAIAYDNEMPVHEYSVNSYTIGSEPVSCAEYLGFIEDDGYSNKRYWSEAGWQWRSNNTVSCPANWRQSENGRWYMINEQGPQNLADDVPVTMLSQYEAQAFASWSGCRLPTEMEWEYSHKQLNWGHCWEWCSNTFYPYPGFSAFPYDGYSMPWFDNKHFTLRGASHVTSDWIKRPSFRNFYTANTRHIFSGLRLAV